MSQFDHESDDQSAAANKLVRDLRKAKPKKDLRIESPPAEKIAALQSAATTFNSDLTQIICRDLEENITEVSVCARGSYAVPLERFLKRLQKQEDAKEQINATENPRPEARRPRNSQLP